MKYLSFDLEATGLAESDMIIEFAAVPFCTEESKIYEKDSFHCYVSCPSYEALEPNLDPWVQKHNKTLIEKAHNEGLSLTDFKTQLGNYLDSLELQRIFGKDQEKLVLFGKSMNAIDLPFLNRDLGWDFMRKYFHHQVLDLSSVVRSLVDMNFLPSDCINGSELMSYLNMGEVSHTALEDSVNTALMYIKIAEIMKSE